MDYCESYCSHGGVCLLKDGHKGKHDSRYCQWTDGEALSKVEGDAIYYAQMSSDPLSDFIVDNT